MKIYKNVYYSYEVEETMFDVDTVFVRKNIRIEKDDIGNVNCFCDEMQMNQMEYLEYLQNETIKSQQLQDDMILDNAYRVAVLELNSQSVL